MADFERLLVPGLTHWNHPGFFAYFATTGDCAGRTRGVLVCRAQPAGDALEDVSGCDRIGSRDARLAPSS